MRISFEQVYKKYSLIRTCTKSSLQQFAETLSHHSEETHGVDAGSIFLTTAVTVLC